MFFSTISLTAGAVQKKMIENSPKNRFGPCNILQLRYLTTVSMFSAPLQLYSALLLLTQQPPQ